MNSENLEEARILVTLEAGLAGFSATCLLVLGSLENHNIITIFSSCMLVVAFICFCHLLAGMYQILYKPKGKDRRHLDLVGKYAGIFQPIGLLTLAFGLLALLLNISFFTFAIGGAAIIYAFIKHLEYLKELNRLDVEIE